MKDCKTREDVLELASAINQETEILIANTETLFDGKILEMQMLRFLPPFVGGSVERALEKCEKIATIDGGEEIAKHFHTLITTELENLDA